MEPYAGTSLDPRVYLSSGTEDPYEAIKESIFFDWPRVLLARTGSEAERDALVDELEQAYQRRRSTPSPSSVRPVRRPDGTVFEVVSSLTEDQVQIAKARTPVPDNIIEAVMSVKVESPDPWFDIDGTAGIDLMRADLELRLRSRWDADYAWRAAMESFL